MIKPHEETVIDVISGLTWKDRKNVAADLKPIYQACLPSTARRRQAATAEEAETNLSAFEATWDEHYPSISKSWRNHWEHIIPFLAYPNDIRKVIYTTNAIESVNRSLRKITKNRGAFPSDEAAIKLLFLAHRNISKRWTKPVTNWKAALNRFAIMFDDRVSFH